MKNKITEDVTLAEILKLPNVEKILAKYNLPCLSCPFAKTEMETLKIGYICRIYNLKIKELLKELNKLYG